MRGLRGLRLSRGQRTLVNLCLCALLLVGLWGLFGYPLPTAELELHRWERTSLMEPSRVAFSVKEDQRLSLGEDLDVHMPCDLVVGLEEDRAVVGCKGGDFRRWIFSVYTLGEEPLVTMIPGAGGIMMAGFSEEGPRVLTPVLAFHLPEEAASGEITLTGYRGTAEVPLTGPGQEIGEGVWLFAAAASGTDSGWILAWDAPCTLCLFRADGSPLPEWSKALSIR